MSFTEEGKSMSFTEEDMAGVEVKKTPTSDKLQDYINSVVADIPGVGILVHATPEGTLGVAVSGISIENAAGLLSMASKMFATRVKDIAELQ